MQDKFLLWRKCCFFGGAFPVWSFRRDFRLDAVPDDDDDVDEEAASLLRGFVDDEAVEARAAADEEDRARLKLTGLAPPPEPLPAPEVDGPLVGSVSKGGPGNEGPDTDNLEWM